MTAINFKMTADGYAAVWNADSNGLELALTHIQVGSGNRIPDSTETALVTPQQAAAIAAGTAISDTQIRMSALFSGSSSYTVREIGVWAGAPGAGGSVLVYYWSEASGLLLEKSAGIDVAVSIDVVLGDAVPPGTLTILADNGQSAMLSMIEDHKADVDAHPQYLRLPVLHEYNAAGTYSLAVPAGYYRMRAKAVGAGGGGAAGATATHGEGGGGGGCPEKLYSVTPGGSVSIVVGAGGEGLIATSGGATNGGNTTITYGGVTITGGGGNGATISSTSGGAPGAGGTASGGDINHTGQAGANGGETSKFSSGGRPGGGSGWGAMADGSSPLPVGVKGGGGAGAPGVVSAGGDGWAFVEFF